MAGKAGEAGAVEKAGLAWGLANRAEKQIGPKKNWVLFGDLPKKRPINHLPMTRIGVGSRRGRRSKPRFFLKLPFE